MRFDATIDYPADVRAVAAMLADDGFVRRKIEASGALDASCEILREGEAFTVTTRRKMPTDQVPSRFRSLVGQSLDVRLVEAWGAPQADGSRSGTLALDIAGVPVRVNGRMSLTPAGEGAAQSYSGDVTASIPLFGKPIEKAAADAVDKVLAVERRIGLEYLAGR
ncbi:DUF2505 domain-containing protein [Georgenia sp. 311]|uniref:DUF2505 domain-containing protein n=1 Tax=Georgenia wutianyii TaxID=2585135 RepID=A0ABX5VJV5_9MICO|nr:MULTISPECIES: DUF2505 domain-containing protein [Georgenia]QDB78669.1 DUF2505 domain-containing protein [Georgenia wutianyii]TNC17478.1 DUF2505 domain-containing protein [Georgenia sp. 311]